MDNGWNVQCAIFCSILKKYANNYPSLHRFQLKIGKIVDI